MTKVHLQKGKDKRVLEGHPWVYDNEIEKVDGEYENGDIVDVYNWKNSFIGRGYINDNSKIRIRILTRKQEDINRDFFKRKIEDAWNYRKRFVDTSSCRVVFGEADFIPGLIVDKFEDYLSIQTLSLGIDKYKDIIVDVLDEVLSPKGIYERNDVQIRELEGLEQKKGFLKGPFDTKVQITENEIKMLVDIENGQKTGYFLDQRENRAALKPLVKGAKVLDTFTHTGGFALHAAYYGASEVTAVDISEHAVEYVAANAALNNMEGKIKVVQANVFDILKEYQQKGERFDVIILDPPAFCKSKSALQGAYRGYKEINLRAMKIINPGGFLVSCSCSHYMYPEIFQKMLLEAANDAKRTLRIIESRVQAKDHPIVSGYYESLYLKCVIMQVL